MWPSGLIAWSCGVRAQLSDGPWVFDRTRDTRSTVQERLGLNRSARGGQAGMLGCKQWRPKKAKLERNGDEMQAAFLDFRLSFYTDRAPNPCWIVWNLNSRLIGISKMYDPSSEHVTRIFRLLCNVWRTLSWTYRVFWLCFSTYRYQNKPGVLSDFCY